MRRVSIRHGFRLVIAVCRCFPYSKPLKGECEVFEIDLCRILSPRTTGSRVRCRAVSGSVYHVYGHVLRSSNTSILSCNLPGGLKDTCLDKYQEELLSQDYSSPCRMKLHCPLYTSPLSRQGHALTHAPDGRTSSYLSTQPRPPSTGNNDQLRFPCMIRNGSELVFLSIQPSRLKCS